MISFFRLVRYKNLIMIAIVQLSFKYFLFIPFNVATALSSFYFLLLVISTLSITAAGYIINDIYDIKTDYINKPSKAIIGKLITVNKAYNLYFLLNSLGVLLGMYLSIYIGHISFAIIFILTSFILYQYAVSWKNIVLISNLLVAVLVAISILIVGIFDIVPAVNSTNVVEQYTVFSIVFNYATFSFLLTLIREIVKDLEDIKGDFLTNRKTIPIVVSIKTTKLILIFLSILTISAVVYYTISYLSYFIVTKIYMYIFVVLPLLYFVIKIRNATTCKDFKKLSNLLKIDMLFGIFSLIIIYFVLKYEF